MARREAGFQFSISENTYINCLLTLAINQIIFELNCLHLIKLPLSCSQHLAGTSITPPGLYLVTNYQFASYRCFNWFTNLCEVGSEPW